MLLGCILSAASCGQWWIEDVLKTDNYAAEQTTLNNGGRGEVMFLPYLMGERSPHNDPNARGVFLGMDRATEREDMTRAVYEGVTYALRDCLEVARSQGIALERVRLCGGGAVSPAWQQMTADILNLKVEIPAQLQGPSLGAAMLAATADGAFASLAKAADRMSLVERELEPDHEAAERHERKYRRFQQIYQALKPLF